MLLTIHSAHSSKTWNEINYRRPLALIRTQSFPPMATALTSCGSNEPVFVLTAHGNDKEKRTSEMHTNMVAFEQTLRG